VLPADISDYFALALLLIREKSLGAASFWAPYVAVLPTVEEVDPTLIWADADLELLDGSNLVPATASLKAKLKVRVGSHPGGSIGPQPGRETPCMRSPGMEGTPLVLTCGSSAVAALAGRVRDAEGEVPG
jgi:hypothetical protein